MTPVERGVELVAQYIQLVHQTLETLPTFWIGAIGILLLGAAATWLAYGDLLRRLKPNVDRAVLSISVSVDSVRAILGVVTRSGGLAGQYILGVRERRLARIMASGQWAVPFAEVYEDTREGAARHGAVGLAKDRSTVIAGKPGAGKTNLISLFLEQVERAEDEPFVVFDYKMDYQQFFDDKEIDYIRLTPSGATEKWNVFREVEDHTLENYLEVAKGVFSEQSDDEYWSIAAAQVFAGVLTLLSREFVNAGNVPTNADLVRYLRTHEADEIHEDLARHSDLSAAAQHIPDEAADAQAAGVISNVQVALMEMFIGDFFASGDFSVREYMKHPDGRVLVLDMPPERKETTAPVFGFLIDWAIRYALQDDTHCTFVLDEFARLPELKQLDALVTQGRSYNTQAFAGVQSIAQVYDTYGETRAEALLSGFNQAVLMQPQSGDSATINFALDTVGAETIEKQVATVNDEGIPSGSTVEQSDVYPITRDILTGFEPGEAVIVKRNGEWVHGRVPLHDEISDLLAKTTESLNHGK